MNDIAQSRVGTVSLRASIIGIVVPVVLLLFIRPIICLLLFGGLQLVAVVSGVIGRRTPAGKAGLVISSICIIVTGGAAFFFSATPSPPVEEIPIVQTERSQPEN